MPTTNVASEFELAYRLLGNRKDTADRTVFSQLDLPEAIAYVAHRLPETVNLSLSEPRPGDQKTVGIKTDNFSKLINAIPGLNLDLQLRQALDPKFELEKTTIDKNVKDILGFIESIKEVRAGTDGIEIISDKPTVLAGNIFNNTFGFLANIEIDKHTSLNLHKIQDGVAIDLKGVKVKIAGSSVAIDEISIIDKPGSENKCTRHVKWKYASSADAVPEKVPPVPVAEKETMLSNISNLTKSVIKNLPSFADNLPKEFTRDVSREQSQILMQSSEQIEAGLSKLGDGDRTELLKALLLSNMNDVQKSIFNGIKSITKTGDLLEIKSKNYSEVSISDLTGKAISAEAPKLVIGSKISLRTYEAGCNFVIQKLSGISVEFSGPIAKAVGLGESIAVNPEAVVMRAHPGNGGRSISIQSRRSIYAVDADLAPSGRGLQPNSKLRVEFENPLAQESTASTISIVDVDADGKLKPTFSNALQSASNVLEDALSSWTKTEVLRY